MSFITTDIDLIVQRLKAGDIAAVPTETVYGLAADYACDAAIKKIFFCKKRPLTNPLILHVLAEWDLSQWVEFVPDEAKAMIKTYWPGPLSLVFKVKANAISPLITANQDTVAIRAPSHPVMQQLLAQFGRPLVAPSANPFEKLSPTTAEHVLKHFPNQDLAILQGGRCSMGMESTIVDMAKTPGRILRPGPLAIGFKSSLNPNMRISGDEKKHYQPHKPCFYFSDIKQISSQTKNYYLLGFSALKGLKVSYQFPANIEDIYHEFYYQLQLADESDAEIILVELPSDSSKYEVIRDRIFKAAKPLI